MTRLNAIPMVVMALFGSAIFGAPAISVDRPSYEVTIREAGEVVRHVFTIRNNGNQSLLIADVRPSCVCTTASPGKAEVPPGESVALSVSIDTTGFEGLVARTVTVSSNDPANPDLILAIYVTSPTAARVQIPAISAKDFRKRFYLLVDVRTPEEFASGHILGAVNIPLSELKGNLSTWAARLPKEVPVILQCRSGVRSSQAAQILLEAGFQNVLNLDGGILDWTSTFGSRYLFGF